MKVKFLQDYREYKKGDILETSATIDEIQGLLDLGVIEIVGKQIKPYSNKMMKNYINK